MPRTSPLLATLLVVFVALAGSAHAAPGAPDGSFGKGGRTLAGYGFAEIANEGFGMRVLDDGSVLSLIGSGGRSILARFGADGELDRNFGNDGYALVPNSDGHGPFSLWGFNRNPDGRISLLGSDRDFEGRLIFSRLSSDGRIDRSFGKQGFAFGPETGFSTATAFDQWGRPLIADSSGRQGFLYRFTATGEPDPTFGKNGLARIDIGTGNNAVDRILPTPDGIIITDQNSILKLNLNGGVDYSFGQEGIAHGGRFHTELAANGKLIVERAGGVARLLPDGRVDPAFGSANGLVNPGGETEQIISLPDASTILYIKDSKLRQYGLIRLDPDGTYDESFGQDGFLFLANQDTPGIFSVAAGPGTSLTISKWLSTKSTMSRIDSQGNPVATFGDGGRIRVPVIAPTEDRMSDSGRRRDGSLLAVGTSERGVLLQSFTRKGRLEAGFGSGGSMLLTPLDSRQRPTAPRLAVFPDGSAAICAKALGQGRIWKVTRDGGIDRDFGEDGSIELPDQGGCRDLGFDGTGLVIALHDTGSGHLVISRLRPDGTPDAGYGSGGNAVAPSKYWGDTSRTPARIAFDRRGRTIVLLGDSPASLTRFRANGRPDRSFGREGVLDFRVKPQGSRQVQLGLTRFSSLSMDGKGRILVGGAQDGAPGLARLGALGFPDRSFGREGVARLPGSGRKRRDSDLVTGMARQSNGGIVLTGRRQYRCSTGFEICPRPIFVFRLGERGKLDRKFSTRAGRAVRTAGDATGLEIYTDSKGVTVTGTVDTSERRGEFALFRISR